MVVTATTNASGEYALSALPSGSQTVTFNDAAYLHGPGGLLPAQKDACIFGRASMEERAPLRDRGRFLIPVAAP